MPGVQDLGVALDDTELTPNDAAARLQSLFEAAKAKDEFEFACALLRVRGMESAGWDPFIETSYLVEDLMGLIGAPLRGHTKVRLGLLLYSHLTEVKAIYSVLANLSRVINGERYALDPFLDATPKNKKGEPLFLSTPATVEALRGMLDEAGHAPVAELFDWFFVSGIRNAFSHADYTLHQDKFRSSSERFLVGGILTPEINLDLLADIFNRALAFYGCFVGEYETQRMSYTASKVVPGRIAGDEPVPVELVADVDRGLHGFRSPPGEAQDPGAAPSPEDGQAP